MSSSSEIFRSLTPAYSLHRAVSTAGRGGGERFREAACSITSASHHYGIHMVLQYPLIVDVDGIEMYSSKFDHSKGYLSTLDGPHPPQSVLGYKGTVKNKKEQHYFLALALAGLNPLEQHTQELQHLEQRRNEYS